MNKICRFKKQDNGWWKCTDCGFVYAKNISKAPTRRCLDVQVIFSSINRLAKEVDELSILEEVQIWTSRVLEWEAGNFIVREKEEYTFIVEVVCFNCIYNKKGRCTCCGAKKQLCKVKAYMDTETCPAMRW